MKGILSILAVLIFIAMPIIGQAATQQAVLTWTDLTNETGYVVERKIGPTGTYAQVGTTLAGVVTYTDLNLVQGTNYCWHVSGVNAVGNGVPSDDACMSTVGVPGKVGGLNVTIQIVP